MNRFQVYVPYGPAGSPLARIWDEFAHVGSVYTARNFGHWLRDPKNRVANPFPFYSNSDTIEAQGYFILPVQGDEIPDAVIAALPIPRMYKPAVGGEPGRRVKEFARFFPDEFDLDQYAVLESGDPACEHDFGLESWQQIPEQDGLFSVTCTRCGRVHAYSAAEV